MAVRDLARSPRSDLRELYARVVASVALGNTADHLRNHGFLSSRGAWTLSPAFDVNPTPDLNRARSTSIAGADAFPDEVEGLLALAEDCSLTLTEARAVMARVAEAFGEWQTVARRNGASAQEVRLMAEAISPRLEAVGAASRPSATGK